MEQLKGELQELINKHNSCNGKNTQYEQALNQVIELIDFKINAIASDVTKKII